MKTHIIAALLIPIAAGCKPNSPENAPVAKRSLIAEGEHEMLLDQPKQSLGSLHEDALVERFTPYDIAQTSAKANQLFGVPHLDVVPAGQTKSRNDVFIELGLNNDHIDGLEYDIAGRVLFLSWRISPSYFFSCMTDYLRDFSDEEIDRLLSGELRDDDPLREKMAQPDKMVYGVRILSRRMR